jgi:hypothetical protein
MVQPGTDPGFVRSEAYTIFQALFKKNNTKLYMKVNIYLGPLIGQWKGPVYVRGLES